MDHDDTGVLAEFIKLGIKMPRIVPIIDVEDVHGERPFKRHDIGLDAMNVLELGKIGLRFININGENISFRDIFVEQPGGVSFAGSELEDCLRFQIFNDDINHFPNPKILNDEIVLEGYAWHKIGDVFLSALYIE